MKALRCGGHAINTTGETTEESAIRESTITFRSGQIQRVLRHLASRRNEWTEQTIDQFAEQLSLGIGREGRNRANEEKGSRGELHVDGTIGCDI